MSTRRSSTWPRGGLNVKGRKKRAKLCLAKNAAHGEGKTSLRKKLRELQGTVPIRSHGMNMNTLFQKIEKCILLLEAKVATLRYLSNLYGV